jgi:hypothetical protein
VVRTIARMSGWVERYRAGDRVQVWIEMSSLGANVRADNLWLEAAEVTRETMRRARTNVERLLELLPANGYQFSDDANVQVFVPPPADIVGQLDRLERRIGPLPLALRCWFEEVGLVNLMGEHPAWDYDYTDPLVVEAPVDYIESEFDEWEADRNSEWNRGAFTVDLAPDYMHKANVSGGPPYSMAVPSEGVDGLLLWEPHQTTFVNYLRICFRWGGFPGWDYGDRVESAKPKSPPPALLAELAEALLPL